MATNQIHTINSYLYSREKQGLLLIGKLLNIEEKIILPLILIIMTVMLLKLSFFFVADPCHYYSNLSEANRNQKYRTPPNGPELCDKELPEGWYRFVGAAGTKMPTARVSAYSCGTAWSGWLDGEHPTVEDSEVQRQICFSVRSTSSDLCKGKRSIFVKNCGLYYIYELFAPKHCPKRFCGTDEK